MDNDFYEIINLLSNWKSTQRQIIHNFEARIDSLESNLSQIQSKYSENLDLMSSFDVDLNKLKKEVNNNIMLITQLEKENEYLKDIIKKEK